MKKISKLAIGVVATMFLLTPKVKALSESDFDQFLTDGKLVVNSVKPSPDNFWQLNDYLESVIDKTSDEYSITFVSNSYDIYPRFDCNDDFSRCKMRLNEKDNYEDYITKDIDIVYSYNEKIKAIVDKIANKIPNEGVSFTLKDMETIRYYMAVEEFVPKNEWDELSPLLYSSEYREFIGSKNFVFEPRMGNDSPYSFSRGGTATFEYNDTIYGYADGIMITVNKVLYVDDNETNIQNSLQNRLSKYIPGVKVYKSITKDHANDKYVEDEIDNYNQCKEKINNLVKPVMPVQGDNESNIDFWNRMNTYYSELSVYNANIGNLGCSYYNQYETANQLRAELQGYWDEDISEEGRIWFYNSAINDLYTVELPSGTKMDYFVIKDSKKVINDPIDLLTVDAGTDVSVSVDSKFIPLDTLIQVKELTDGETYNKLLKILNETNVEMFDLKLFAKSADKYITKLEDGTFEVRIPISDEFQGKDLIVYYVDDNNNIEAHEVNISEDGNFAIFTTNHFSIYTLTEKTVEDITEEESETNPNTLDNITKSFMLLFLSGSTLTIISLRRKENN